jgi:hypothetical protein
MCLNAIIGGTTNRHATTQFSTHGCTMFEHEERYDVELDIHQDDGCCSLAQVYFYTGIDAIANPEVRP